MNRIVLAFRCFFNILFGGSLSPEVLTELNLAKRETKAPAPAAPVVKASDGALQILAILQRDSRLLDFLMEDVQAYSDAQIGAGVRQIHADCRKALQEHLALGPVMADAEGATVTVPPGFDPSAVRLTGNVTGQPPFRGTLLHRGWRVKAIKLAPPPEGQDEFVLQPAEVELP